MIQLIHQGYEACLVRSDGEGWRWVVPVEEEIREVGKETGMHS